MGRKDFPNTRWSLVVNARSPSEKTARAALEELCSTYWYPLYAFARRSGLPPADAEDATQGFFAALLAKESLDGASPEKGRLRSFLLRGFRNFMTDTWRTENRQKRGAGVDVISFDAAQAEQRFTMDAADHRPPEAEFERRWALTLIQRVYAELESAYNARGKEETFNVLRGYLEWNVDETRYAEAATALGMTENAVQQAVLRLRRQFRRTLERVVAETLEFEADMHHEIDCLIRALS